MTKRIFRSVTAVALGVFTAAVVLVMGVVYHYFSNIQLDRLHTQTTLAAQGVNAMGAAYFEELEAGDCRISWIDSDGTVLYDSRSDTVGMENHLEREEIREALEKGRGESLRYSSTILERSAYSAVLLEDGTVLRIAMAQDTVIKLVLSMLPVISLIVLGAILLSLLLASRLSKSIIRPLNELDLDNPLAKLGYDEMQPLLRRIDSQQRQLRAQREELRRRQDEFAVVTDNMNEGLMLLDKKGTILSINAVAAAVLFQGRGKTGESIFSVDGGIRIDDLVENALAGRRMEKTVELGEERYRLEASPVVSNGSVSGAVLLIFNITEKEAAEKMRREFTANVSHELKTPLHAISGYAELLKSGIVKQEDIVPFSEKIYGEAQRMVRLVEDIIHLSSLDEAAGGMSVEEVDLYALAGSTLRRLEALAQKAGIRLSLEGESAVLRGIPQLLDSIVYNLCDNAIKYNNEGGVVKVNVKNEVSSAILSVADNGIGIPVEHQERIFERFYRVDKSRSKEKGGTGLGLSIVKHGAKIHNAKIDIESAAGMGTVVTVRFPK